MTSCNSDIKTIKSPFLFLALDLPAAPLFQDLNEMKIIPQVSLSTILAKFDGENTQEIGPTLKRHHLTRLPPYLILHIKRFTKNNFVEEKNPTIVNYPMAIDLKDCESGPVLVSLIVLIFDLPDVDPKPSSPLQTMYNLLANVPHESTIASTSSAGTGPGISLKKSSKVEDDTTWKASILKPQLAGTFRLTSDHPSDPSEGRSRWRGKGKVVRATGSRSA